MQKLIETLVEFLLYFTACGRRKNNRTHRKCKNNLEWFIDDVSRIRTGAVNGEVVIKTSTQNFRTITAGRVMSLPVAEKLRAAGESFFKIVCTTGSRGTRKPISRIYRKPKCTSSYSKSYMTPPLYFTLKRPGGVIYDINQIIINFKFSS